MSARPFVNWTAGFLFSILGSLAHAQSAAPAEAAEILPSKLSLAQARQILRARGYDVLLAEASAQAAAADVSTARAIANPQLSLGVGRSFGYHANAPGASATSWSAGIADQGALADTLFGKRHLRVTVAEAALNAARRARDDALRTLDFQVKSAYVQVAVAERVLEFAFEVATVYAEVVRLTEVRLQSGAVSEAEAAKALTAELEAEQDVTGAQQQLQAAKAGLVLLLGVRGAVPMFEIDRSVLDAGAPASIAFAQLPDLQRLARESRADLRSARAQVQSARASVDLAYRQRAPDVVLGVQGFGEGTGQNAISPPTLEITLGITPPLFTQYRGPIDRATAEQRSAELTLRKLEAQVAADVNLAHADFVSSSRRLERMRASLLATARKARDLVRIQYEKGAASLLELLDAQRTFISNNLESLQDAADFQTAVFEIEQAVGKEMTP